MLPVLTRGWTRVTGEKSRESDPKIALTEILSLEGGRRRACSPMYHSGHPYTHAGSPGEKDKDCGKGKNKSELQGLGEFRKGVKTDADKLRGADFTWLKKKPNCL